MEKTQVVSPPPITPDAISTLCQLAQEMIRTKDALPELRATVAASFANHEDLIRANTNAIVGHMQATKDLLVLLKDMMSETRDLAAEIASLNVELSVRGRV